MTFKEIADMVRAIGLPFAYYQFDEDPENPPPDPPFICFYYPNDNDFIADDRNYVRINSLIIELYTDEKDFDSEAVVEAALLTNDLPFDKAEAYIESEHMFQITYTMEVLINAEQN